MSTTTASKSPDLSHLLEPQELSRDALRKLIALAERPGTKLIDWERLGTPLPDRFVATMDIPAKEVGQVVQAAFAISGLRTKITGFPNGIPAFEAVRLQIDATAK